MKKLLPESPLTSRELVPENQAFLQGQSKNKKHLNFIMRPQTLLIYSNAVNNNNSNNN